MSLTVCPECSKLVQGSAQKCPFCGANFPQSLSLALASQDSKSDVKAILQTILSERFNHVETKEIKFRFGSRVLSYPSSMQLFARIYGKYYSVGQKLREKYYALYKSAGNIHTVLTSLTQQVIGDIDIVVQEAIKDLYDCGIMISDDNFKKKYNINFPYLIVSLYQQYEENLKEKQHIEINKEIKKAGRRWQGGGFGIKGAIKGAVKAEVLNFATEALHSLFGDNSDEARNRRELIEIYRNESNKEGFADSVFDCCQLILFGTGREMTNDFVKLGDFQGSSEETASLYENTIKFEKDPERLFYNMVSCIQQEPEKIKYYTPILQDLFEKNCDLKSFLSFWNLNELYDTLEESYRESIVANITNPLIKNISKTIIQVTGSPIQKENRIIVEGKVIKGDTQCLLAFMTKDGVRPLYAFVTDHLTFNLKGAPVEETSIGKKYYFIFDNEHENLNLNVIKDAFFMIDLEAFLSPESALYATYEKNGQKKIWGFAEESKEHSQYIYVFTKNDGYTSNLEITFNSSLNKIKEIYGNVVERYFYAKNDPVYNCGKELGWKDTDELEHAEKFLSYNFGNKYIIRFYFNESQELVLVAYLKCIESISNDLEKEAKNGDAIAKICLEHWDEFQDIDLSRSRKAPLFSSWIKAWQGDTEEQFHLANCYKCGTDIEQDDDMALNWYKKAAENGHPEAKIILEHWEDFDIWKIEDEETILSLYVKAWKGDAEALFHIANDYMIFLDNKDEDDYEKALEYYKKAAENGFPEAKTIVEHWEDFKNFETTDEDLIISWVKATEGDVDEQFKMGHTCKSLKWYKIAAENGHPDSKIIVEHWDEYKDLNPWDDNSKKVTIWLKAWQGDSKAQYELSKYFPEDSDQADIWLNKAASGGNSAAKAQINEKFFGSLGCAGICLILSMFFSSVFWSSLFAGGFWFLLFFGISFKFVKNIKIRNTIWAILIVLFILGLIGEIISHW